MAMQPISIIHRRMPIICWKNWCSVGKQKSEMSSSGLYLEELKGEVALREVLVKARLSIFIRASTIRTASATYVSQLDAHAGRPERSLTFLICWPRYCVGGPMLSFLTYYACWSCVI